MDMLILNAASCCTPAYDYGRMPTSTGILKKPHLLEMAIFGGGFLWDIW